MNISGNGYAVAKMSQSISNNPVRGFPRVLYDAYFCGYRDIDPWANYTEKEALKWLGYLHGDFRDKCLHSLKHHVFNNPKRSIIVNEILGVLTTISNLTGYFWIKIKFHE